jgi:hypothetical protein
VLLRRGFHRKIKFIRMNRLDIYINIIGILPSLY